MKPKINRLDFFTVNDGTLVQLIGESEHSDGDPNRRIELCQLLNRLSFTLESYGAVNFFMDYQHEVYDLLKLSDLLEQFNDTESIEAIRKSIHFYEKEQDRFVDLRSTPPDYDSKIERLNAEFASLVKRQDGLPFHIPLGATIKTIAQHIREFPDDYCTDENGLPIDKNYTGVLQSFYPKGTVKREYNFVNGRAHGECADFNLKGDKKTISMFVNGKLVPASQTR